MIILDTNVISEVLRAATDHPVVQWLRRQPAQQIATTTICMAEMLAGAAILPPGPKRDALHTAIMHAFDEDSDRRVLPFDSHAAEHFAQVIAVRRSAGRPIGALDAQIAAIAVASRSSLATRNIKHFAGLGIELIDPWSA